MLTLWMANLEMFYNKYGFKPKQIFGIAHILDILLMKMFMLQEG